MKKGIIFLLTLAMCFSVFALSTKPIILDDAAVVKRGELELTGGLDFGINTKINVNNTKYDLDILSVEPFEIRYGVIDNLEIGFGLPISREKVSPGQSNSGLKNISLSAKYNFFDQLSAELVLAAAGDDEMVFGNDGLDVSLNGVYSYILPVGYLHINFGFTLKSGQYKLNSSNKKDFDDIFKYGVAYIYPVNDKLNIIGEMLGYTAPVDWLDDGFIMEIGTRYNFNETFNFSSGLGFGLTDGSPDFNIKLCLTKTFSFTKEAATAKEEELEQKEISYEDEYGEPETAAETAPAEEIAKDTMPEKVEPPVMEKVDYEKIVKEGNSYFKQGQYTKAAASYEKAIMIKNDDPVVFYNLATTYYYLQDYKNAMNAYQKSIELNPNDADAHLYLGYVYYELNLKEKAIIEWKKVVELEPDNQTAISNLRALGIDLNLK